MRERLRELGLLVRTAWRTDPWRSLGTLLEPLGGLMYPLLGVCLGVLADGILQGDRTRIGVGCSGLLLAITLRYVAAHVGTGIRIGLAERVGFAFDQEIARLAGSLPGLEHHERPDYQDRLELLRQSQGVLGQSLNSLITTANALVSAVGTGVVLALVHPFVLLLVLFALPALPIAARQQRWQAGAEAASATPSRLARHLRGLTVDRNAGTELRVFGLQDEVLTRMSTAWSTARRPLHLAELKGSVAGTVRAFVFAFGFALAVGFVLWRASRGVATAGEVVTAVVVCRQVQHQVLGPTYNVAGLGKVLRAAGRLLWLQDYAAAVDGRRTGEEVAPARLTGGVTFDRVRSDIPERTTGCCATCRCTCPRARWSPSWARTVPARRPRQTALPVVRTDRGSHPRRRHRPGRLSTSPHGGRGCPPRSRTSPASSSRPGTASESATCRTPTTRTPSVRRCSARTPANCSRSSPTTATPSSAPVGRTEWTCPPASGSSSRWVGR